MHDASKPGDRGCCKDPHHAEGLSEEKIGPRPSVWVCKGCPAYETEKWREPSGDGETYDNGQYAWCNAAGRKSMGAYHYDHSSTPEWCPARAEGPAPPADATTYSEPEVDEDDGVVTVRAFSTDKLRVVSFAVHPDHVLKVTTPGIAERFTRPAPSGGEVEALVGALHHAMGALREAEAVLGGEYGDSYGSLVRDMMNLEVAAELALGAVGELPLRQWPQDMDEMLLAVADTARRQGALQYERAIARAYQLGERAALTKGADPHD